MEMVMMVVLVKMVFLTLPYAKEEVVMTMAAISPWRRPQDIRIWPFSRWKKVSTSGAASENSWKNKA
jgi:hypothetical protein